MKKKRMKWASGVLAAVMLVSCLVFTGCSNSGSKYANGELNIFVWTEYLPDSVIEDFEKEYGIKVNVSTFSSNEDMLAKVKSEASGTYDIVQPSDYMVAQMIAQGMLEELDQEALTNLGNLDSAYLDQDFDPKNTYSVPYRGGVAAIAVNTELCDLDITSYADLFDESLKGKIVALDDFRAIIGVAARSIGYSMNETDPEKLAEVETRLLELKNNIKVYDSDSPKNSLISQDCSVGIIWSAEIALAMEENDAIKIVFPEEGPYVFLDNFCVMKDSPNYDNAMRFINYTLDAEVSAKISEEYPYLNPNTAAIEKLGSAFADNEAKNVPSSVIANGEWVANLDTNTLAVYDEMWTKLKQ